MKTRQSAAAVHAFRQLQRGAAASEKARDLPAEAASGEDDASPGAPEARSEAEAAVLATFNFRCVLENQVAVEERFGQARLSGRVRDRYEYWLAEYTAAECPGVKRVINEIAVEGVHAEGSDDRIEFLIARALLTNADVARGSISVKVRSGVATLAGWVKNLARKGQAEACALGVPGVRAVSSEIRIGERARHLAEKRDDASIVGQIRSALRADPLTGSFEGAVSSSDGFVAMAGGVGTEAERRRAGTLALGVFGVKSVVNGVVAAEG